MTPFNTIQHNLSSEITRSTARSTIKSFTFIYNYVFVTDHEILNGFSGGTNYAYKTIFYENISDIRYKTKYLR